MPGKNRYPLVGWHSRRPELVAAARAEAERRGITLAALLDEALEAFLRPAADVTAAGRQVRTSADLYCAALADAIDWAESLIAAGDTDPGNKRRLARYRAAYAKIAPSRGPITEALETARPVPIQDIKPNERIKFPGSAEVTAPRREARAQPAARPIGYPKERQAGRKKR